MILSLKNIGKVESAKVELNGITVIAGENDTGKSTIGKALYSIFNGFYIIETYHGLTTSKTLQLRCFQSS